MGMTMSQKILAAHAGLDSVKAGQLINAELDMVLGNDITSPVAVKEFEKAGFSCIKCPAKVSMVMDHFTPNKDIKAAEQVKTVRNFGADSHTCTYGALGAFSTGVGSTDMAAGMMSGQCWFKVPSAIKFVLKNKPAKYICGKDVILHIIGLIGVDGALYKSMEFVGDGIRYLSIDDRFTICNMAIEAGAKNGIFPVDDVTREYLNGRFKREIRAFEADPDAEYEKVIEVDMSKLEPTVSFPHLPENTRTPKEWGDVKIDQVVIGSCTNGHISDLRIAAEILKGKHVAKGVRCIVIPATNTIWKQAMHEGLFDIFIDAGAVVSTPTCGPCLGGHMGILAAGERAVATTNRNFVGRMGHVDSEVYLASPYVAAASAIAGKIATPDQI